MYTNSILIIGNLEKEIPFDVNIEVNLVADELQWTCRESLGIAVLGALVVVSFPFA